MSIAPPPPTHTARHGASYLVCQLNIAMCIPTARQQIGEHIPTTHANATIEGRLLGNGAVNTIFNNTRRNLPGGRVHPETL
jgi:hypothetical protein